MKLLSVILIACMFFLTAFSGLERAEAMPVKKLHQCCKKMAGKVACHHQDNKADSGCDKPACTMMFSCSLCGFIVTEPVRITITPAYALPKPVSLYKMGDLSAYHASNWKPPRTC
ncbi:hypothetical protein MUY27_13430 [Mucilaginibacter sp. RS28]|uniref:Uncharacterized protein n=1 Tax=Mucilaginibacter straminoryzae TaxID=2932774 RepID=A0A9X1X4B5_9SPHI|nr:hypothetical protein [Mucilaginibacter straminoryzae]MCJ8210713.1 hypothetical protein [Mucilaginibacter straminoryzae]